MARREATAPAQDKIACHPSDGGCYAVECDDADVLDGPAYERTRADVAGELRSARCTPRPVHRWSRTEVVFGDDRCDGPTARDAMTTRAREWSDHVRSVVAHQRSMRLSPIAGEC